MIEIISTEFSNLPNWKWGKNPKSLVLNTIRVLPDKDHARDGKVSRKRGVNALTSWKCDQDYINVGFSSLPTVNAVISSMNKEGEPEQNGRKSANYPTLKGLSRSIWNLKHTNNIRNSMEPSKHKLRSLWLDIVTTYFRFCGKANRKRIWARKLLSSDLENCSLVWIWMKYESYKI